MIRPDSTRRLAAAWLAAACLAPALPARAVNHELVVAPVPRGPFRVACSNVEQDAALIAQSGAPPADFWEGSGGRYISQILAVPGAAVRFAAPVPDLRELYPQHAGGVVDHVAIVCHPTPASNTDPDYPLPGSSDVVPHMQPPGARPRLIGADEYAAGLGAALGPAATPGPARLPLLAFSHGLGGSPISSGHIDAMVELASQGFMVGAVFHGDERFSRIRLEDLGDFAWLLTDFDKFVEMQLMRPVSLKTLVDVLLADPGFAPGIDTERIGGFGASMGGQAIANLMGARLTASLGGACRESVRDPRVKAAVGLVPYAGQTFLPSFCKDQEGAASLAKPYLAISGSADTTAPIGVVEQAVNRFSSSRYLVELEGVEHEFTPAMASDVFTWTVTFLRAYLGVPQDPGAMGRLIRMGRVQGGPADNLRVDVHVPSVAGPDGTTVVEFYNDQLAHYFIAASGYEVGQILSGAAGPGWSLTGQAFNAYSRIPPDAFTRVSPVCRFYGAAAGGPNSHFFTVSPDECEAVKRAGGWYYEGIGFFAEPQTADGRCPEGLLQVRRAYNLGFPRNDSNHRFTTSDSTWREMQRHGWALEGVAWCARP